MANHRVHGAGAREHVVVEAWRDEGEGPALDAVEVAQDVEEEDGDEQDVDHHLGRAADAGDDAHGRRLRRGEGAAGSGVYVLDGEAEAVSQELRAAPIDVLGPGGQALHGDTKLVDEGRNDHEH